MFSNSITITSHFNRVAVDLNGEKFSHDKLTGIIIKHNNEDNKSKQMTRINCVDYM